MSKRVWDREKVIENIRFLHTTGHDLAYGNAVAIAPRLVSAATRLFGSWRLAVEALGIDYSVFAGAARERTLANRQKWSTEQIVERIRELAACNESLRASVVSMKYPDLYGAACSARYFGGWSNAMKAAGVEVDCDKVGGKTEITVLLTRWKATLLLERINQITGHKSAVDEDSLKALAPTLHAALIRRFGSWDEVLRAVGTPEKQRV